MTANVNGVEWTEVIDGGGSGHYVTENGVELDSDISVHGTWTLLDNGSYSKSGPVSLTSGPEHYKCSGNSLRLYPSNGSLELTRSTPRAAPPAS